MKIKRLTAGFAVAAMAATFFAAAPILSANAAPPVWNFSRIQPSVTAINAANITPDTAQFDLATLLKSDPTAASDASTATNSNNTTIGGTTGLLANPASLWRFTGLDCYPVASAISDSSLAFKQTHLTDVGSVTCSAPSLVISYTPAPNYGVTQPEPFFIIYQIEDTLNPGVYIWGYLKVTVTTETVAACTANPAECLAYSVQAWTKTDKKATSVSVPVIAANIETAATKKADGFGFIPANKASSWKLIDPIDGKAIVPVSSSGNSLSATVMAGLIKQSSDGKTVVFTPPADWSGVVTYQYTIGMYDGINLVKLAATDSVSAPSPASNLLTITVQPTLTAPDAITSDPNTAVTVPLLGKGTLPIIGSKQFQDASCVFASNGKTKDTTIGKIVNAGKSANPVFTPNADFQGSVDLTCTVNDTYGVTSNAVTVNVLVGAVPAPAATDTSAAPAPVAPACTSDCGTLVSTGGSLATPMTSGLAAVVLLVAAGAGVLVIRRRTSVAI